MSYIILKGYWCDIIIQNVHVPTEDKINDMKDRFYKRLEHVFDKFPKYRMKILLEDFNAKVGKENIFKRLGMMRHYATSWKVVGSSPNDVDYFNVPNPSSHTMALGLTQPVTEMSTRNLPGGKG
jgi:hypothetical protein